MNNSETIGQYIRKCREQIGLTLTEFAKRLELSKSYVSDIERGNRPVSDKRLATMSYVIVKSNYWRDNDTRERWLALYHIMLEKADLMSPSLKALKKIEDILDEHGVKKKAKLFHIMAVVKVAYFKDLDLYLERINDTKE